MEIVGNFHTWESLSAFKLTDRERVEKLLEDNVYLRQCVDYFANVVGGWVNQNLIEAGNDRS